MKTSNKLLLGAFVTILLMITGVHVALYAKYEKGQYTIYNPADHMPAAHLQTFSDIKFVSVRNVNEAMITFSDSAQLNKADSTQMTYIQKGDSLIITGSNHPLPLPDGRHDIAITLPYSATISFENSFVSFEPGKNAAPNNPVIYLHRSQAFFLGGDKAFQFGHMKVFAKDSSAAVFQGINNIDTLEAQLSGSAIDYMNGNFGKLSILTDSISRISLQTKHLLRADIKLTGQ